MSAYRDELIQVAAVAVAMLQVDITGSTDLFAATAMGTEEDILAEIQAERRRQEAKWGTRTRAEPRERWYTILGEEFGEVGRAILEGE